MPLFVRSSYGEDASGNFVLVEGEAIHLDATPEWRTRPLTKQEASNVKDVLLQLLHRSDFSDEQIAQVLWSHLEPQRARHAVRKRLNRMNAAFAAHGFEVGEIP